MNVICYYPVIKTETELIDILSRAAWFFSTSSLEIIYLPVYYDHLKHNKWQVAPGMDPVIEKLLTQLKRKVVIKIVRSEKDLLDCLEDASMVLQWKKYVKNELIESDILVKLFKNKTVWQVDPYTIRMEGSFYIEAGLSMLENKKTLIEKNKTLFKQFANNIGSPERAYLLATGPSVDQYRRFIFEDALNIVCNSVILDENLMNEVKPQILTFADPIFHFGPSQYAAAFRKQLLDSAEKHDFMICIPFKYYGLLVDRLPELSDRIIGIPFTKKRNFNFNLKPDFMLKTTANILTLLMIPLASSFANDIFFLGCDGRPLENNNYFWDHNKRTQFNEKLTNIKDVHPGFFNIDYNDYYIEHCQILESQLLEGEKLGKSFFSLAYSHIPALKNRLGRGYRLRSSVKKVSANQKSEVGGKIIIVDPDALDWSGHFMAYNDKLSAQLEKQGYKVNVLCNRNISPNIIVDRDSFDPTLTVHSWSIKNTQSLQNLNKFKNEFTSSLKDLQFSENIFMVYMYCGSLEHAKIFAEYQKSQPNVFFNINLFWLSFYDLNDKAFIEKWFNFFSWLDIAGPFFVATLPTAEIQIEVAELFNVILDVAPHPSTSVSDDNFLKQRKQNRKINRFTVLFPGTPRKEKGFNETQYIVQKFRNHPELIAILRHAPNVSSPKYYLFPPKKFPDNVIIVEGVLSANQFEQLFQKSDIVVLPYTKTSFSKRTSGLLIDALYYNLPAIVLEGTWLARIVKKYECGIVVENARPDSLIKAIKEVINNYCFYRNNVINAADIYYKTNSWEKLANSIVKPFLDDNFILQEISASNNYRTNNNVTQKKKNKPIIGPYPRISQAHIDETNCIYSLFNVFMNGKTMLDVGAHHGSALMPFLKQGWRIFAFEPDAQNRNVLRKTIDNDKVPLITIDKRAVSNKSENNLTFFTSEVSTGISSLSAFHESHQEGNKVDTITLSEALITENISSVDFLKIDTEGHDLFVLQGFPWERFQPAVIECEFEDAKTLPLSYSWMDMADYLINRGYTVYVSEWHPIIKYGVKHDWCQLLRYPCELSSKDSWGNLLAFRDGINERLLKVIIYRQLEYQFQEDNNNAINKGFRYKLVKLKKKIIKKVKTFGSLRVN